MSAAPWHIVPASAGGASHVEHVDAAGKSCGPLLPERSMPRAGEYGPGVEVCCIACGDAVAVPPHIARKVRADERAWEAEQAAAEERAKDLARLRAAGVDVSKLPPPRKPAKARRVMQLDLLKPRGAS